VARVISTVRDLVLAAGRLPAGAHIESLECVRRDNGQEIVAMLRVRNAEGVYERQHHSLGAYAGGWR
jgi:hypothetical protein